MEATPREILLYETPEGRVPFREWLESIQAPNAYDQVRLRLDRVEEGNLGNHHGVGEGVFELVVNVGPGYRIYFGQDGKELVILLVGGTKRTQTSDIEMAKHYWRTYNA